VDTSRAIRLLTATAVVSALAILLTSPAQAYVPNEGVGPVKRTIIGDPSGTGWVAVELPTGAHTVGNAGDSAWIVRRSAAAAQTVGNPGDSAQVSSPQVESVVTSSASDGPETGTFIALASGIVLLLALGAGALLFTQRHRRVALP
jgi:hypothetical protein